jgi:hypothetical protein
MGVENKRERRLPKHPHDDSTLSMALWMIDPDGTLVPGTEDYDTVKLMIQGWIGQYGRNRALCMARLGAKHLGSWRKFL